METRTKEFVWTGKLSKENKVVKWGGDTEGVLEQIILKLAVLGPGAVKGERNIVQVTTFDSEQNKISACICSLTVGQRENQQLADLSLFPPANFTLIEGSGPVHMLGNHVVLDEDDLSDDEDISDFDDEVTDLREKLKAKSAKDGKGDAPTKSQKKGKKVEEQEDEEDSEEDEDDDDLDEDDFEDDDEEEEVVIEQTPSKKRKLTNGKSEQTPKKSDEKKITSPDRGIKKEPKAEQKTPKSENNATQQTPKSGKKTPAKPKLTSVEEVKAAIKKYPGGKPRKEDKFLNWLSGQFKVTDDAWKGELWKWHKKEMGL